MKYFRRKLLISPFSRNMKCGPAVLTNFVKIVLFAFGIFIINFGHFRKNFGQICVEEILIFDYLQVVWAESIELGVGRATSEDGMQFVVARYYPAGNMMGDFADNVFKIGTPPKQLLTPDTNESGRLTPVMARASHFNIEENEPAQSPKGSPRPPHKHDETHCVAYFVAKYEGKPLPDDHPCAEHHDGSENHAYEDDALVVGGAPSVVDQDDSILSDNVDEKKELDQGDATMANTNVKGKADTGSSKKKKESKWNFLSWLKCKSLFVCCCYQGVK